MNAAILLLASALAEGPDTLLTRTWTVADGAAAWRCKENATLAVDAKTLRLASRFDKQNYTWATWNLQPCSAAGTAHVDFTLVGDGSGHPLDVNLGARGPDGKGTLYYTHAPPIRLDFRGPKRFSLSIDNFATPRGGIRDRDLAAVIFVQFFVRDGARPLELGIAAVAFSGPTAEEQQAAAQRAARRRSLVAAAQSRLADIRSRLAATAAGIDAAEKQGRSVALARVYHRAAAWSADDIERATACEELAVVERAGPLAEALAASLETDDPAGRIGAALPAEGDRAALAQNPYYQSIGKVAAGMSRKETTYPKGRKGYAATPNAWTFAHYGSVLYDAVWSLATPGSEHRHQPTLVANALNLLDHIAQQHSAGDFNVDRTAIYGHDGNINRFCLAPTLDAWLQLKRAYPRLLPAAKEAEIERGLKVLADYQVTDYGTARHAREPHVRYPAYPNMDVHHLLIMHFAHLLWGEPRYAGERDAFLAVLEGAVYPGGAFTYINTQNECFVYHHLNVAFLARYWKLTGCPRSLALLKRTVPYYPNNVEPAGMPEYYTDACWKHYWSGGSPTGPDVIAGLFDDRQNKQVAQTAGAIWGYGHGYLSAIAADFWKPLAPQPLRDGYAMYDPDICGPRGRFGPWSFGANGRDYRVGYQGKDTFVGAMLTDAAARPLPLDAALQLVTTEVRLDLKGNHWTAARCFSARERTSTTLGPDFGALAVAYTVSKPNWHHREDELLPWDGRQQWYLSKSRLVGLVSLEATADEDRAGVWGRVRLGMSKTLEADGPHSWRYGGLRVAIHGHNYARIDPRPSETFYQDKPENYRSTEITLIDPPSAAAKKPGPVRYPRGSRYWFLVEVHPATAPPAAEVRPLEAAGLAGFSFAEGGKRVWLVHNVGTAARPWTLPADGGDPRGAALYRDNTGRSTPLPPKASTEIPSHGHIVVMGE